MSSTENEKPTCVYLVYCDSLFTTLSSPSPLTEVFWDREKAEAYLAKNPRPGHIEKWLLGDFNILPSGEYKEAKKAVEIVTKTTYDYEAIEAERSEIEKKKKEQFKPRDVVRTNPKHPNWT